MTRCGAVVVAAGSSRRMGLRDKTVELLRGKLVVAWVLSALAAVPAIEQIVVVTGAGNEGAVASAIGGCPFRGRVATCPGGATRAASVAAGVAALDEQVDLVLVHDAARPLVTTAMCVDGIHRAEVCGAAVAAVPVSDTIKRVDAAHRVIETLPRDELYAVQTPQVFRREWLEAAYRACPDGFTWATDEAALLERAGFTVEVFPGSSENLKLTTPTDLLVAEALLARRTAPPQP